MVAAEGNFLQWLGRLFWVADLCCGGGSADLGVVFRLRRRRRLRRLLWPADLGCGSSGRWTWVAAALAGGRSDRGGFSDAVTSSFGGFGDAVASSSGGFGDAVASSFGGFGDAVASSYGGFDDPVASSSGDGSRKTALGGSEATPQATALGGDRSRRPPRFRDHVFFF
ncbi:uncharacterized protein LOC110179861 isoform X1 [Drosophila serrata]|uniref:uncharacterized protein LOC110179861 isoform X1 n=1 Tax=Drosophila serrata TaxID=7274 RepID=UPI000A1CF7EF|nr:uncharacterized protein LOC110179861 isoform X1 [Drosophila serrata]